MKTFSKNKSFVTIVLSVIVSLVMVYLIVINYVDFSETLISNEQKRILAVSDAIARSIEENINYDREFLMIISKDTAFMDSMRHFQSGDNSVVSGNSSTEMGVILEEFYEINNSGIDELSAFDSGNQLLRNYPSKDKELSDLELEELAEIKKSKVNSIGNVHFPKNGSPYLYIYMPVIKSGEYLGVLRGRVSTDYIYNTLVKPTELGIVGYASVKTDETILLMHPGVEDIGKELMTVRRDRFPDYDWSELERVVGEQLENRRGVSIYHSVWAGDESGQRVKKFSAYSSAQVGEHFWIVTIAADYNQVVAVIRKNLYITLFIAAMIFVAVIFALIITLITRQHQRELVESISHNKALEKVNSELAEDIKQRKLLQNELSKTLNKYAVIFANTQDCIFIVDFIDKHIGGLLEQNLKASEVFEYTDEELIKISLDLMDVEHDIENLEELIGSLNMGDSTLYETVLVGKNGVKVPVEAQCSVFELDGKRRILYIARDISKRKQEEQILIRSERRFLSIVNELASRMKDQSYNVDTKGYESNDMLHQKLEQINIRLEHMFKKELDENRRTESLMLMQSKNASMGEMIGNIAHQWRQPLNTLNFILVNMMDEIDSCDVNEESKEYLAGKFEKGFNIIQKMSETINDFRHFFKPEDDKKEFELLETVNSTLQLLEERMKVYDISIDINNQSPISLYGYSSHLSQVFLNIINNSIDAHKTRDEKNPDNRQKKRIVIDYTLNDNAIEITLADNAGGIEDKVIENIFDPYFTTKDMQNGTGLGLYMSKTIIEKHFGGDLSVENKNEGACFTIRLMRELEEDSEG